MSSLKPLFGQQDAHQLVSHRMKPKVHHSRHKSYQRRTIPTTQMDASRIRKFWQTTNLPAAL